MALGLRVYIRLQILVALLFRTIAGEPGNLRSPSERRRSILLRSCRVSPTLINIHRACRRKCIARVLSHLYRCDNVRLEISLRIGRHATPCRPCVCQIKSRNSSETSEDLYRINCVRKNFRHFSFIRYFLIYSPDTRWIIRFSRV